MGPEERSNSTAASEFAYPNALLADRAPYYEVPTNRLICVEHPFRVQTHAKAIESLGGSRSLERLVSEDSRKHYEIPLFLHPGQRGSNSVVSGNVETGNLLCQVTVPKLNGRKRKRGNTASSEPSVESSHASPSTTFEVKSVSNKERLIRGLSSNTVQPRFKVIGVVEHTHRFRTMPDFVYSVENNAFMSKMRKSIMPLKYDAAKTFAFDMKKGTKDIGDLIPPPLFSDQFIPFSYLYQQNPAVKNVTDAHGNISAFNDGRPRKVVIATVPYNGLEIPTEPPQDLAPFSSWDLPTQNLITKVVALFQTRPIWTRRALLNQVKGSPRLSEMKHIYAYAGYEIVSGPWQNTIAKYGVDPRIDPACRIYQVMNLHLDESGAKRAEHSASKPRRGGPRTKGLSSKDKTPQTSHVFDGENVTIADGKSWQVCDIQEQILQALLATSNIRKECHLKTDGWYHNGTWAKARTLLKAKIQLLLKDDGEFSQPDFVQVAALPENFEPSTYALYSLDGTDASQGAKTLATRVRAMASRPETTTRTGTLQLPDSSVHPTQSSKSGSDARISQSPVDSVYSLKDGNEESDGGNRSVASGFSAALGDGDEERNEGSGSLADEASTTLEDGDVVDELDGPD